MTAWRYEISLRALKNIPLVRCAHSRNIFQHEKYQIIAKGAIYCVTIAAVIFSRVKITGYFHV